MCGIAGIYRFGKEPIKEETIALLLTGNEHRGNDAAGIAFLQANGDVQVSKLDVPAWKFSCSEQYEKFVDEYLKEDTRAVIIHARGASQGNPRDNNNNHPMFAGQTAVIHNGMIHNDDDIFNHSNLERKADTDSDVLRAILDKHGFTDAGYKELNKLNGSIAGAAISSKYPGKLLLLKSGSPMCIASTKDYLIFSSEKKTIYQAMRPIVNRFKMFFQKVDPNLAFSFIPEHTLWLIGPEGKELHTEFKTCMGKYVEPVRKVYEKYSERQEEFDRDAVKTRAKGSNEPKIVKITKRIDELKSRNLFNCSNVKCSKQWMVPLGKDPKNFVCDPAKGGCGQNLNPNIIKQVVVN